MAHNLKFYEALTVWHVDAIDVTPVLSICSYIFPYLYESIYTAASVLWRPTDNYWFVFRECNTATHWGLLTTNIKYYYSQQPSR